MAMGTENFDSLTIGLLDGQGSGSGWSGNWVKGTTPGLWTVETTTVQAGANAVSAVSNGVVTDTTTRLLASAQTSGIQTYWGRINVTTGELDFGLFSGGNANGNAVCWVRFDGSDNVIGYGPAFGTTVVAGTYTANAFHQVDIDFNCATSDYRIRLDGGAWTARIGFVNAATSVDRIGLILSNNTTTTNFIDSLSDGGPASGLAKNLPIMGVGT